MSAVPAAAAVPEGGEGKTWCPSCEEDYGGDARGRICVVCGTDLDYPPARRGRGRPPTISDPASSRYDRRRTGTATSAGSAANAGTAVANATLRLPTAQPPTGAAVLAAEMLAVSEAIADSAPDFSAVSAAVGRLTELSEALERRVQEMSATLDAAAGAPSGVGSGISEAVGADELLMRLSRRVREMTAAVGAMGAGAALGGLGASRPTSAAYLRDLPRSTLEPSSSLLVSASVTVAAGGGQGMSYVAIPGEFGGVGNRPVEFILADAPLVYCGTGKGGIHPRARNEIQRLAVAASARPVVALFDRGGDVTFARKALLAQQAGASAAIVGNTVSRPWPYRMKDLAGEAAKEGLRIPIVMVRKEDASEIRATLVPRDDSDHVAAASLPPPVSCRVEIRPSRDAPECPVCLQPLEAGETVLQLRECLHLFHEPCAMHWLESHNTCPYCRHELPTDDPLYEQERRRQHGQRNDDAPAPGENHNSFYG